MTPVAPKSETRQYPNRNDLRHLNLPFQLALEVNECKTDPARDYRARRGSSLRPGATVKFPSWIFASLLVHRSTLLVWIQGAVAQTCTAVPEHE